jgi:hypothetical protein
LIQWTFRLRAAGRELDIIVKRFDGESELIHGTET